MRVKNEGKFTVRMIERDYNINCKDFYIKDGFLVIEHNDGDIEYILSDRVSVIVKYNSCPNPLTYTTTGNCSSLKR